MKKQNEKTSEELFLNALRLEVWKNAIGNDKIARGNHYYEQIRTAILQETGFSLNKDTIRNFCEKKHTPSPQTLDIYCTYVLNGNEEYPRTFSDFQTWHSAKKTHLDFISFLRKDNYRFIVLLVGILIIIFSVFILLKRTPTLDNGNTTGAKPEKTIALYKRFYSTELNDLKRDEWFLFKDSIDLELWNNPKYKDSGFLTLETHLGGPFLDNKNFEPLTINIPSKKIKCGSCCKIFVKLVKFNPYQRYQQAGLFIFYNETSIPSISFTFVGITDSLTQEGQNLINAVKRDGKYSNHHLIPENRRSIISQIKNGAILSPIDSLVFQLVIENDEYSFLYI